MTPLTVLVGIAVVFAVVFVAGFMRTPPDPIAALTTEYLQLMRLGSAKGREHLEERLEAVRARFPGRSRAWLLRWLVDDLRRAKR